MIRSDFEPDEKHPDKFTENLYPKNAASYWSLFVMLEIGALGLATPVVLAATWPIVSSILLGYAIAAFWTIPVCLVFAGTQNGYLYRKSGTVECDGETIRLFADPKGESHADFEAPLAECRWFHGYRSWATFSNVGYGWGSRNDLLLVLPDRFRTRESRWSNMTYDESPVIVALGNTPSARQCWEDLFYRYGVEHEESYEKLPTPISEGFGSFCVLVGLFAAFPLCGLIASVSYHWLSCLHVPGDIARGISFPFFVPGCIFIFINIVIGFSQIQQNQTVKRTDNRKDGMKGAFVIFLAYFILLGYILIPVWIMGDEERYSRNFKISATVSSLLLASLSLPLSYRLAKGSRKEENKTPKKQEPNENPTYSNHFDDAAYK